MGRSRYKKTDIANKIWLLHCDGFGGRCYAAAKEINEKVFDNKGLLVAAVNKFWYLRGRFLGHVAVLYDGVYWDADARPKTWEDIESWGMLDPEDEDFAVPGFNEYRAAQVVRLTDDMVDEAWRETGNIE